MIDLLIEGLDSAFLPCSLILLVPGAAAAIAARQEAAPTVAGFVVGTSISAWLRFSGRIDLPPNFLIAVTLGLGIVCLVVPLIRRIGIVSGAGGMLTGAAVASLWLPCVGVEFGTLLGELSTDGATGLFGMLVYVIGVLSPLVVVAAVIYLIPDALLIPARPVMLIVGATTLCLLALAILAGLDDEITSRLVVT